MLPSVGQSPPTVEAFDGRRVANKVIASCDFDAYCCFILRQATGRRLWLNSRPNMTRSPTRLWPSTLRRISLTIRCYGASEEEAMEKCGWPGASSERIAP